MATEVITTKIYGGEVTIDFYPKSHMYKITDPANGLVKERVKGVTTYLGIKDKSAPLVSWATETAGLHLYDILSSGNSITMDDVRNAINRHKEIKDEAATIGTAMHEWCEYFIKYKLGRPGYDQEPKLPADPQILLGVNSFLEWYINHDVEFIDSEKIVYSRKHRYVGTLDFKARVDGKLTGGDFKSSNGLYNSVLAQISAYIEADEEEQEFLGNMEKYENRVAIRLSKEVEEEYNIRMERKNLIKGNDGKEFETYQPFEWKVFDGRDLHERDLQGFLHAKNLFEWDKLTDFYLNK